MALPFTDDYERANGPLGASYTVGVGDLEVDGGLCLNVVGGAQENVEYVNSETFADDQKASALIGDSGSTFKGGVALRCSGTGASFAGVGFRLDSSTSLEINTWSGGTFTFREAVTVSAWADAVELEVELTGTTAKIFRAGVQQGSDVDLSSYSIAGSGAAAPFVYGSGFIYSFAADSLGAPTPTAAVTGTATASITEADIVTGGKTIIVTLTDDTWVAVGGVFDAIRQDILNGLDAAQAEGTGWDAVVKAGAAVTDVVRTSDTVVTITLEAFATYDITVQETITVTVPISATVTAVAPIIATPTFSVAAAGGFLPGGAPMQHEGLRTILSM